MHTCVAALVLMATTVAAPSDVASLDTVRVSAQEPLKLFRHGNPESAIPPDMVQSLRDATAAEPMMWFASSRNLYARHEVSRVGPCMVGADVAALVEALLTPKNYWWEPGWGTEAFMLGLPEQMIPRFSIVIYSSENRLLLEASPSFSSYWFVEPDKTQVLLFNPHVLADLAMAAFPEIAWPMPNMVWSQPPGFEDD